MGFMEFIAFEPGDGTRYHVVFHRMTEEEAGISGGQFLFGFAAGSSDPLNVYPFQDDSADHERYFQEKTRIEHPFTLTASRIAFTYLVKHDLALVSKIAIRVGAGAPLDMVLGRWNRAAVAGTHVDWRKQLDKLGGGG